MRLSSLLTSSVSLFIIQQAVSLWFVSDYLLAKEASKMHDIKGAKIHNLGVNSPELDLIHRLSLELKTRHCHPFSDAFDHVILMLVDALGSDFIPSLDVDRRDVTAPTMPFIETLLKDKEALGLVSVAGNPTVTFPRVKSIITGSIPSFFDVISNLAEDIFVAPIFDDNIVKIAKSSGKSLVFYGDVTWLRLVSEDNFVRLRKTESFYTRDYTSVDTNVTEEAIPETERETIDWDFMFLHYLGLDHIGHTFGSNHETVIFDKLLEIDDVVGKMVNNLKKKKDKTLLIITGDHGMSLEGNHGADAKLEKETALIFIPINLEGQIFRNENIEQVQQIDLATTITFLTNLPTPLVSWGVPIKGILEPVYSASGPENESRLLCNALDNLEHLATFIDTKKQMNYSDSSGFSPMSQAIRLLEEHSISDHETAIGKIWIDKYLEVARLMQKELLRNTESRGDPILFCFAMILTVLLTLFNLRKSCIKLLGLLMPFKERILCFTVGITPIIMQVSINYIDYEHYFWPLYSPIVLLAILMFYSVENSSEKFPRIDGKLDGADIFILVVSLAVNCLWSTVPGVNGSIFATICSLVIFCNFTKQNIDLAKEFTISSSMLIFSFGALVLYTKSIENSNVREERIFSVTSLQVICFLLVIVLTCVNFWSIIARNVCAAGSILQKLSISWVWMVILLSRCKNYPILVSNVVLEARLNSVANAFGLSPISRCLIYMLFARMAFFNQGNTNLFSSIDVKPAFFGQTMYNVFFAIPLVATATYASEIYWYMKLFQRIQGEKKKDGMQIKEGSAILDSHPDSRGAVMKLFQRIQGEKKKDGMQIKEGSATLNSHPDSRGAVRDLLDMINYLTMVFYMFVLMFLGVHTVVWSVLSPKLVYHWVGTMAVLRMTTFFLSHFPFIVTYLSEQQGRIKAAMKKSIV